MSGHLWEAKHAYYCNEGNYFESRADQPVSRFKSWAKFLEEFGDSDMDYNLLFRWDWLEGPDNDLGSYNGDENYRHAKLLLFFMGQRQGRYFWSEVEVCRADEPAIIAFLRPRLQHLISLWTPLSILLEQEPQT
jgi:hypothetical protein